MKETVITWTVANWITVFLMFSTMAILIGFFARLYASAKAKREG